MNQRFSKSIKLLLPLMLSIFALTAFSQKVDLCKGIQHVSKSLASFEALMELNSYGELRMGFSSSYADHPYLLKNYSTDSSRGRYTLMESGLTETKADKIFNTSLAQLKSCFGTNTELFHSSYEKSTRFKGKGLNIFLARVTESGLFDNSITYCIYIRVEEDRP